LGLPKNIPAVKQFSDVTKLAASHQSFAMAQFSKNLEKCDKLPDKDSLVRNFLAAAIPRK